MNILFDLGHPAHFHLFKNFIIYLQDKAVDVTVVTRDKDVLNLLVAHEDIPFQSLTKKRPSLLGMMVELFVRDWKIFKLHLKTPFDFAFGTSASIGHLSLISRCISYNFNEDDDFVSPYYELLAYPFSNYVVNPSTIRPRYFRRKRLKHDSYHELAYLHPDNFTPDLSVIRKYNLQPHEYIIIRKSALAATHDIGAKGIDREIWNQILKLTENIPRILSIEGDSNCDIDPWDMHHVMAFAKMLISDSQTMSIEGAVLGTPVVRYCSFVGRSSVLQELEDRYTLAIGFKPDEGQQMVNKVKELIGMKNIQETWQQKRAVMLNDKVDLNQWIIGLIENLV